MRRAGKSNRCAIEATERLPSALCWKNEEKEGLGPKWLVLDSEPECSPVVFCSTFHNFVFCKEGKDSTPLGARKRQ